MGKTSHMAYGSGGRTHVHHHLLELLASVNDWLKFAETKNSTGLTLSAAALAVLTQFTTDLDAGQRVDWIAAGLAASFILLVMSICVAALSFLPQTRVERRRRVRRPSDDDNLMYYGHLAELDHEVLTRAICERYLGDAGTPPDRLAEDLARQIVTNAAITVRKLRLFRITVLLFVVGAVIGMVTVAAAQRGDRGQPAAQVREAGSWQALEESASQAGHSLPDRAGQNWRRLGVACRWTPDPGHWRSACAVRRAGLPCGLPIAWESTVHGRGLTAPRCGDLHRCWPAGGRHA